MPDIATPPTVDSLIGLLNQMQHEHYGEHVTMLEHSLQSAAVAEAAGASDDLVIAALLHDVGHLLGDAGEWGLASHAEVGAQWLSQAFGPEITEPIRLHVDAKRFLVATDPNYLDMLSRASVESLREQGGAFDDAAAAEFRAKPYADEGIALRRYDDDGKTDGLTVEGIDYYRPRLEAVLAAPVSAMWARDACRCHECRDPTNGQRLFDIADVDGLTVISNKLDGRQRLVEVADAAGIAHTCRIPLDPPASSELAQITWDATHLTTMTVHDGGADLHEFATDLATYGIALAAGLATTEGTVLDFASRIGFVRNTNYGDLFDVRTKPNPENLAYTATGLPAHTDNPYRDPVPTVQLLHCVRPAAEGGGSQFVDGFHAADLLREEHPEDFALLTRTMVPFRFRSADADLRAQVPIISRNPAGEVARITVNSRSMEAPPPGPEVERFYQAYQRFVRLLARPELVVELTLKAGELVAFDNRRVLHGRSAYEADPKRHLQGCYIDIDAIHSTALLAEVGEL